MKLTSAFKSFGSSVPKVDQRMKGTILVTGATGVVAYRVAAKLLATGYPSVRIGVPDVAAFQSVLAEARDAELVEFDWDREETYANALKGATSVFIAFPHHEHWEHNFYAFLALAQQAGVNHFVKLSFYHAMAPEPETVHQYNLNPVEDPFLKVPFIRMHRTCDTKLTRMSVVFNYTLIFASHFMSNAIVYQSDSLRKEHRLMGSSHGKGVNYVSPNDIADVAVRALLAPKEHFRVGYTVTGPSALTDVEVAGLLGERLGAPVSYVDQPLAEFASRGTDWGPAQDVAYLEMLKSLGVEEIPSFVSKDVSRVCGRPAETFADYLNEQDLMTPQELSYLLPCS
jgi:uncharacterized protein YbjT (DUF2867 family)